MGVLTLMPKINWRSAEVIMCAVLLVQVLIMLIDFDTKQRIVRESVKLREAIKNGRIQASGNQGSHSNHAHNFSIPGDMVANGHAGMAEEGPSKESDAVD